MGELTKQEEDWEAKRQDLHEIAAELSEAACEFERYMDGCGVPEGADLTEHLPPMVKNVRKLLNDFVAKAGVVMPKGST